MKWKTLKVVIQFVAWNWYLCWSVSYSLSVYLAFTALISFLCLAPAFKFISLPCISRDSFSLFWAKKGNEKQDNFVVLLLLSFFFFFLTTLLYSWQIVACERVGLCKSAKVHREHNTICAINATLDSNNQPASWAGSYRTTEVHITTTTTSGATKTTMKAIYGINEWEKLTFSNSPNGSSLQGMTGGNDCWPPVLFRNKRCSWTLCRGVWKAKESWKLLMWNYFFKHLLNRNNNQPVDRHFLFSSWILFW